MKDNIQFFIYERCWYHFPIAFLNWIYYILFNKNLFSSKWLYKKKINLNLFKIDKNYYFQGIRFRLWGKSHKSKRKFLRHLEIRNED